MLQVLKIFLSQIVSDIDNEAFVITDAEAEQIVSVLRSISDPYVSKYQACQMLNISRATFDSLVRKGLISKGLKRPGFKELAWRKSEILEYAKASRL